ncbi:ABC transporter substrate-binding protein [Alkalibaculum bacchi]|uniref:ABC transporter substrate-binding protein n=1 Tax=Alkalibaculum bacchi TaxID=645887 RepID=UPI0026F2EB6E|nr:ABC transporter substrate-binding protein [Alkalibaculum bacchi]
MVKIQIQLPLNMSRGLEEILREHIESGTGEYHTEIEIENCHACGTKGEKGLNHGDIMIGFMPELAVQTDEYILRDLISTSGRFPISKAFQCSGFIDPQGYFHTFGIVPFVMFYNPDYTDASEIPRTWSELLHPKWKGRIMMPGKEHMAPKVIRAILKYQNPNQAQAIEENITCSGMPPNVIEAVRNGEFSLGITNITFGKISENYKIRMIWPEDGLLCMPQIIAWKKGLDESLLKLGDFMLSSKVQNFLKQQSFVPVSNEVKPPEIFINKSSVLKWTGWDSFRQAMKNSAS